MKFTKKLSKKQIATYLKDPLHCLFCRAYGIKPGDFTDESNETEVLISCPSCGQEWADIWTLTAVDTINIYCTICNKLLEEGQNVELSGHSKLIHSACLES